METNNETNLDPLVSIICITYNHERYIKKALDSFLMQKTDFNYEIIVYDDASVDNNQKIIKEYAERYPNIIRAILQKENQYSKGTYGAAMVCVIPFKAAKGKYIAYCEGDDYWIDENKLQKQVDFLKKEKFSLIGHKAIIFNEEQQIFLDEIPKKVSKTILSIKDLLKNANIPSLTMMFEKKHVENLPEIFFKIPIGDLFLKLLCAEHGKIGFINETMAVYRVHSSSVTHENEKKYLYKQLETYQLLYEYYKQHKCEISSLLEKSILYTLFKLKYTYDQNMDLNIYIKKLKINQISFYFTKLKFFIMKFFF